MKSINKLSLVALTVMSLIPAMTLAQNSGNKGYLVDGPGRIVTSGYGLCWHTGEVHAEIEIAWKLSQSSSIFLPLGAFAWAIWPTLRPHGRTCAINRCRLR